MNSKETKELMDKISVLESQNYRYYQIIKRYYLQDFVNDIPFSIDEMFVLDEFNGQKVVRLVDTKNLSISTIQRKTNNSTRRNHFVVSDKFIIYTDGGCVTNPGKGSCGYVVVYNDEKHHEEVFFERGTTTNNRMEMKAIIMALKWVLDNNVNPKDVVIKSDSTYCVNGINNWVHKWVKKNKTHEFKNMDLWMEMKDLQDKLKVDIRWVKGHNGNKWNEYIDNLIKIS